MIQMQTDYPWYPQIDRVRCTACGECTAACLPGALAIVHCQIEVVSPAACTYCAACEDICPVGAIGLPYQISFDQHVPETH